MLVVAQSDQEMWVGCGTYCCSTSPMSPGATEMQCGQSRHLQNLQMRSTNGLELSSASLVGVHEGSQLD